MATEILVNDGGAPARIMNLGSAGAAIEAGIKATAQEKVYQNLERQTR